ncbi:hypothetical protein ABIC63_004489 [Pseudacidovorax sp. 1753]|uniref:DUF3304 domain-containing protein n=1 Tax=unclassified Pseudacidovorax TaxID=2620592 RepID=UPI001B73EB7B|nr:DUF3304 domain-containing protein [Pseudacidovorax sp.]MBP6897070.1 DUF3304 domain-containing protein [Pseudacidovorax sp.]
MKLARRLAHVLAALALALLAAGCAGSSEDLFPDKRTIGVPVGAVGHYGKGIGVPLYTINDRFKDGGVSTWGGGGAGNCCVLLPRKITGPVMVTIRWQTYRSSVDELLEHEATVPIHFAVDPGEGGSGLYVHFLPGHTVAVWYAEPTPLSSEYPGPAFPRGPAPPYRPLPGEKPSPQPTKAN